MKQCCLQSDFSSFPVALLASCDAFKWGLSEHVEPLRAPAARRFQDEGQVQVQPHLVHDMGWANINESSHSQAKMDSANISQLNPTSSISQDVVRTNDDENLNVEDEMEVRKS